jgi:hypothetical protein
MDEIGGREGVDRALDRVLMAKIHHQNSQLHHYLGQLQDRKWLNSAQNQKLELGH